MSDVRYHNHCNSVGCEQDATIVKAEAKASSRPWPSEMGTSEKESACWARG